MKFLSDVEIQDIFQAFSRENPQPKSELDYVNPFTLVVSVVLSAQATDKSVNAATAALYERVKSPRQMVELGEEGLIGYIKSIGLFRNKAKNIIGLSKILCEKYGDDAGLDETRPFPKTMDEFLQLPGVGRKSANVAMNVIYGEATMPVDTHILRISKRIGFCNEDTPDTVEAALVKKIPEKFMQYAHHHLVLHGRYVCTARNPKCESCLIEKWCKKNLL